MSVSILYPSKRFIRDGQPQKLFRTLCGPFADPLRTLCRPFADPSRTLCGPFADPSRTLRGPFADPLRTLRGPFADPLRTLRGPFAVSVLPLKIHFLGHTWLIIGLYGAVFHGEDARDVQKCVALQNRTKNLQKLWKICKKSRQQFFWVSKNEMSGIVWNAFCQSLKSVRANFEE